MSRQYTHVQGLLPSVIAMKEKGYTYRQIADQIGMEKEQIEELCSRERRKQRKIEKGYIPQPKGRPRKTPATQEQLQSNRIVELEMKVELLQNFLSEYLSILDFFQVLKGNIVRTDSIFCCQNRFIV